MKLDNHPDIDNKETLEEAKFNAYKEHWNEYHTQLVKSNFLNGFEEGAKWKQERNDDVKDSFENKALKWWMTLTMNEQVEIGFKYDEPTFNLTLRAIMFEYEQFKKK